MKTRLDPEAAVDGVAEITKRTSQLSHTLFDIASGLVVDTASDSSIPQAICNIAREFADIAQLCLEACALLERDKGGKKTDAGIILGRLDTLIREFEDALNDFVPNKVPRWLKRLFQNESVYLITKCHSIKEPLRLFLSVLRIADVRAASKKTSNKKKKRRDEIALQVIKVLMNAERRLQKGFPREALQLHYWTESPGATATWIYELIFNKVLSAQPDERRRTARGGRVKTVDTAGANGVASDSEQEDDIGAIPPDLERELDLSPVRSRVINELLERWTGLSFEEVRQLAESSDRGRSRLQDTARRVIKWYLKNEKASSDDGGSPPAHSRGRTYDRGSSSSTKQPSGSSNTMKVDDEPQPTVRAPTPPASPKTPKNRSTVPAQGLKETREPGKAADNDQAVPQIDLSFGPSSSSKIGTNKKPADAWDFDLGPSSKKTGENSKPAENPWSWGSGSAWKKTEKHSRSAEDEWGAAWGDFSSKTKKKKKGKAAVELSPTGDDNSKAFVFGESRVPSVKAPKEQDNTESAAKFEDSSHRSPGATSSILGQFGDDEPNPWIDSKLEAGQSAKDAVIAVEEISELDLNNTTKGKAAAPLAGRAPSPDIVLPKASDSSSNKPFILRPGMDELQTFGGQEVRITMRKATDQPAPKKSTLSKLSGSDSNGRRPQSGRNQTSSRVEFVDPEPERTSDRRSRDERAPTRESSKNRKDDEMHSRVSTRHSTQSARYRHSNLVAEVPIPQTGIVMNSYSTSKLLPGGLLPHISYPTTTGSIRPYMGPYTNHYPNSFYEPGNLSDNPDMVEIRKQLNEFIENEKARRMAEEARKEDGLMKAQRDEKESMAHKAREQELMKIIREMQESARYNAEKWEDEKRAFEKGSNAQAQSNEQTQLPTEPAETRTSQYKEEVDRLYGIIERFNREKNIEWAMEKERIEKYANTELNRRIEECEEQQQEALEEAWEESRQYYQELIETEKKKVQDEEKKVLEATMRAEVYVQKYNDEFARRQPKRPSTTIPDTTKASQDPLNVFDYLERPERNSSLGSSREEDTESAEVTNESELLENKWRDRDPYMHTMPQPRAKRYTAFSEATSSVEEASNVIIFPPRAGWNDMGHNQLGNYLSMSGFTPMFEEREPSAQDPTGRREKIGTGGNVLRGTLFWQPPASTAEADLYKSLRSSGWRPTYVRTTVSGQTWFFGAQPVHAQFFSDMYKPQVGAYRVSHARPDTEKESLIISKDLVEIEELEFLGHIYKESDGKIFLDPTLTSEDIDHIVARSFLAREGRYRKRFRNTQLRASQTKVDITELTSEVGDSVSEISFGSREIGRERTVSLWSMWSPWSR
ncbi:uncharacterized protein N0V89_009459 [Didymosphaeria variabile]|uniref:Uncharacterized protein n=1 Tax=Didymosphaeria variabile TaxID=1932322 RepID=A0A9W9C6K4_9PLEO|nr:uncharacterized protein N0V89_009459 [Didymosphaeria variabile]KAJ4348087.1 hypothetical protein N0V89_009459 [Didymosphaeria variabile]